MSAVSRDLKVTGDAGRGDESIRRRGKGLSELLRPVMWTGSCGPGRLALYKSLELILQKKFRV